MVASNYQTWLKKIIGIYNKINQLESLTNTTPATVGEYFKKNCKN